MSNMLIRAVIENIIEEQRLVINIEDDISLTTQTKVEEQEEIQKAWPKTITYKENLLFDGYNLAFRQAIKELNIDKTYVRSENLDENIDKLGMQSTPESDRFVSTSEDSNAPDIISKRTRVTGMIKYFSYIPSEDKFVLGFDMADVGSFGFDNVNNYVALVTVNIKYNRHKVNETEITSDNIEKIDANYQNNLDYIENKVKIDHKGKDVIIIFKKTSELNMDVYKS